MKILLVEDSDSSRMLLEVLLQKYGYETVTSSDGVEALECLKAHPDIQFIVTDWLMPNMDGLELCKQVRAMDSDRYVYLLVLTQKSQKSALVEGMEAGADDFLFKPVDKDELRVRIQAAQRVLNLEQNLATHNQQLQQAQAQIQRDLQAASHTQVSLLPKPSTIKGYAFDWRFYPSQWVAGDMLNFFPLTEQHIAFYQLDVSGHGIHSALLSFALHHRIINETGHSGLLLKKNDQQQLQPCSPDKVASQLNQLFQNHSDTGLYFTLVYGVIHTLTGQVDFTQAGHPSPVHLSQENQVHFCGSNGFPVGLLPDADYETQTVQLMPGDALLIYSDGVTDCQNGEKENFGAERLQQQLMQMDYHSAEQMAEQLGQALNDWNGEKLFEDDVTLLAIQREH